MSFQEKSTWVMLVIMLTVYGWYFATVAGQLGAGEVSEIEYRGAVLVTVLALVALAVVTHIVIALADPQGSDTNDERDRTINIRGEYVGGYVLATGALAAMAMAMFEIDHFWIANALLLGLVVSEVVAATTKVVLYRRGF